MKYLVLKPSDFVAKAKAVRAEIFNIETLRKMAIPVDGQSFLIGQLLLVWVPDDKTPDDGVFSVRPNSISESSSGRYRRVIPAQRAL